MIPAALPVGWINPDLPPSEWWRELAKSSANPSQCLIYADNLERKSVSSNRELRVGTLVKDRNGYTGIISAVSRLKSATWYKVRFPSGEAVRYPTELTVVEPGSAAP